MQYTVESVIKTYLSKFTRLRSKCTIAGVEQQRQVGHKTEVFDTSRRNYFGSEQKTARVTWTTKDEMGENILSGKLSNPLKETVNRYRNYRVTKSSALFIRLDSRDNSVQVRV